MNKKAFTVIEFMVIVVIMGLLIAMIIPACQQVNQKNSPAYKEKKEQEEKDLYSAWIKINKSELTFEEWRALKNNGMLPK